MKKSNGFAFVLVIVLIIGFCVNLFSKDSEGLFRISAGYGVPYGYMGVNFEINPLLPQKLIHLNNYLSFSLGLGYKESKPLLALGINGYPLGRKGFIQPRLSFYYAKIDRILDLYNTYEEDYDTIEALCLGGGFVFQASKQFSLNFDLFYLAHVYDDLYEDTDHSKIKLSIGGQLHLKTSDLKEDSESSFLNFGFGIGIPYGAIGINLELNPLLPGTLGKTIHNYFSISIGSGFSNAGSTHSVGFRIYPFGKEKKYLPRIGIYYGTVAVLNWGSSATNLEGYALSLGIRREIKNNLAVDFDLIYIFKVFGWTMKELDSSRFKVSFGIRYMLKK